MFETDGFGKIGSQLTQFRRGKDTCCIRKLFEGWSVARRFCPQKSLRDETMQKLEKVWLSNITDLFQLKI